MESKPRPFSDRVAGILNEVPLTSLSEGISNSLRSVKKMWEEKVSGGEFPQLFTGYSQVVSRQSGVLFNGIPEFESPWKRMFRKDDGNLSDPFRRTCC